MRRANGGGLRERAEHRLRGTPAPAAPSELVSSDGRQLVDELQVHQIELEMQNDELRAVERQLETQNDLLRAADQELELSRAQYRDLFDLATAGYVNLDTSGVIRRANRAAEALLGVKQGRLLQRPLAEYAAGGDVRVLRGHLRAAARESNVCEVSLRRGDGRSVYARLDSQPAPGGGCWIVLTDISERKRAEAALFLANAELEQRTRELASRNETLEEALAARAASDAERSELAARLRDAERLESLGLFAGGVAHDFNNLLVGVLAHADMLLETRTELGEGVREGLVTIKRAALSAAGLTRQLLVYAGRGRVTRQSVQLEHSVLETVRLLQVTVPARVELRAELAPDAGYIDADPGQIQQVISNLVTNALEAMEGRAGSVVIRTRVEQLDAAAVASFRHQKGVAPGSFVVLEVEDTGSGIDAARLSRIFEPFFTSKFTGRGLGLASVLGIVHSHHAALHVRSTLGRGSTFEIAWPSAVRRPASTPPPPAPDVVWKGSGRLLLVDDDPVVRRTLARQLTELGFTVTRAASGTEALRIFRARPSRFRLAVVDWTMPDLSGDHLIRRLHELEPALPVLLVSGYSTVEPEPWEGHVAFVAKPMTLSDLRDAIVGLLDLPQAAAASAS